MVFIAHSLGGIIVKHALATAYNTSSGERAAIYVFTFALFLFGVPHRGSSVPRQAWASIATRIFQLCGNSINASFLNSVTEGSSYAEQLEDGFKPLLGFYNVFTVCETKGEGAFGIVGGSRILENQVATNSRRSSRKSRLPSALFQRMCITQIAVTGPSASSETQTIRCGSTCPKCSRELLSGLSDLHITAQSATQGRRCFVGCPRTLEA